MTHSSKKTKSWADIVENKPTYEDNVIVDISQHNDQEKPPATPLFALTNNESPFLIGVRGRNISLIRKYTHMLITIDNYVVHMQPIRPNHDFELAWRMVFSASYGGILRWFETPQATKRGYPKERSEELEALAAGLDFSLDLLRSRRGHMCLMLIPQFKIASMDHALNDTELDTWKSKTVSARQIMLKALSDEPKNGGQN